MNNNELKFIESPKSTYILRAKPAKLTCKVVNGRRIRFACNSKWVILKLLTTFSLMIFLF